MPWTVVKFLSTDEVEAIPTSWVDKAQNTCVYPPMDNPTVVQKLIKNESYPESNWEVYYIQLMTQEEFATYKIASVKASRACKVSDLDEQTYAPLPDKRHRKKKVYSSSSTDSEESLKGVPTFPKKDLLKQHQASTSLEINSSANQEIRSVDNSVLLTKKSYQDIKNSDKPKDKDHDNESNDQESFQRQCLTYLVKIKKRLEDQDREIEVIKKMIENIHTDSSNSLPTVEDDFVIFKSMPATNEESMSILEEALENKSTHDKLVRHLSIMGGKDVREFIRRCLKRLLCDELAQNYSLHGHKGKKPFYVSNCYACVRDAAQKQYGTNLKEIELIIGIWLSKSSERVKIEKRKKTEV